jgi:hypothetical protein
MRPRKCVRLATSVKTSAPGTYLAAVLYADDAVVELDELNNLVVYGPID